MRRSRATLLLTGALAAFPGLIAAGDPGESAPASAPLRLTYPGAAWSLVIDLPGFQMSAPRTRPDGSGMALRGENVESGALVSIFLERAALEGDATACRDYYWKDGNRGPLRLRKLRKYERGEMALVEYVIPKFQGVSVDQKNLNAYLAHDGFWIDIHLSKVGFVPEDQKIFDGILGSVRFEAAPPAGDGAATRP